MMHEKLIKFITEKRNLIIDLFEFFDALFDFIFKSVIMLMILGILTYVLAKYNYLDELEYVECLAYCSLAYACWLFIRIFYVLAKRE